MSGKKGYWIAMVEVTDPDNYPSYVRAANVAFQKYGAKFPVRGGHVEHPEGFSGDRCVVVEFESLDQARACYDSAEYQEAVKLRHAYGRSHFAIVEGA